jgi:hypothetical protein
VVADDREHPTVEQTADEGAAVFAPGSAAICADMGLEFGFDPTIEKTFDAHTALGFQQFGDVGLAFLVDGALVLDAGDQYCGAEFPTVVRLPRGPAPAT